MRIQADTVVKQGLKFAQEDRNRSWQLLLVTLVLLLSSVTLALVAAKLYLAILAGVLIGLLQLRLFAFFHDTQHGAIFSDSNAARLVMTLAGLYLMTPPEIWRETHNFHHRQNAKLVGSQIGSYPIVTQRTWLGMTTVQRFGYRLFRHPLNIVFGYVTIFIYGMVIAPLLRAPRTHWMGLLALVMHFGSFYVLSFWFPLINCFFAVIFPLMLSSMIGSYLFYVQHNFPDQHLNTRDQWSHLHAALKSSSMFDMHPLMHWFTGNIGYHHVHHLNAHIPFYKLPEAMRSISELRNPGRTSWRPGDIRACLNIAAWDTENQCTLSYKQLE